MPDSIGTRHDADKVMLGASLVPAIHAAVESVPGSIKAGYAVRKNTTTGAYQVASSGAGPILGISMGKSPGNAGTFGLCHSSPKVALRIKSGFTPTVGTQVNIDNTTGEAAASGGGATAISAVYLSLKDGIDEETGESVDVAIVDLTNGA